MSDKEARRQRIREAAEATKSGDSQAIVRLLDSPEPAVREHAAIAIGRLRTKDVVPALIDSVKDDNEGVRRAVAGVLVGLGDPTCRDTLWSLTSDTSDDVRRLALRGLARLGDPRAVDLAIASYSSGGTFAKQEGLDALVELGEDAGASALKELLDGERSWWWRRAIWKAIRTTSPAASH